MYVKPITNTLEGDVQQVIRQRGLPGLGRDVEWLVTSGHTRVTKTRRVKVLRRKHREVIEAAIREFGPIGG